MEPVRRTAHSPRHKRRVVWSSMASAIVLCSLQANAVEHTGTVERMLPPDSRPCLFFTLTGVSVADPSLPSSPWFAIRQSQNGYKETFALLLAAKHTGLPVTVSTTGGVVTECGHAGIVYAYHAS